MKTKVTHKVFTLCCDSGNELKNGDVLTLVIEGKDTGLTLDKFFENYEQSASQIKGHSIFSDWQIEDYMLINPSNLQRFCFKNNTNGENVGVHDIKNNWWAYDEITMSEVKMQNIQTILTAKVLDAEKNNILDKEKGEEESPVNSFDIEKIQYIKDGYQEFKSGNYRLLYKQNESPILVKLSETEYEDVDFEYKGKVEGEFLMETSDCKITFDGKSIKLTTKEVTVTDK